MKSQKMLNPDPFGEAEFLAKMNLVPVSLEELRCAVMVLNRLPRDQRNEKEEALRLTLLFDGDVEKALAILCRVRALINLIKSGPFPYVMNLNPRSNQAAVHKHVFLAATTAPILDRNCKIMFDREKFLVSLAELLEPEGTA